MPFDCIWHDARLLTMAAGPDLAGATVGRGAVAARDGRIAFAGPEADLPAGALRAARRRIACEGRWITPGLIDSHTHLVHAGSRAGEFEQRLAGASYEAIARAGGGILSTVRATRAADEDTLVAETLPRLDALIAEGVTTVEIKSGYGLEQEAEVRQLRAARRLGRLRPVSIATSFLGAHALPPEADGDGDRYIGEVADQMLPALAAAGLVDAVDAFCERIAFSPGQVARLFARAASLGLPVRLHADQLSNCGGAALAARFGALSADHLEHADEAGIAALARAGTVAVLLPGAYYTLHDAIRPPVAALRTAGVPLAVATDANPGSSPLTSLLLAMNMAATLFRLTVGECLAGVTREAARALGLLGQCGTLETGKWCDLAIWDIERPADLVYRIGLNPLQARVWHGETLIRQPGLRAVDPLEDGAAA